MLTITGVGTLIINFPGPALSQRHDPAPRPVTPSAALHIRKSRRAKGDPVADGPHLESDATLAVKKSRNVDFVKVYDLDVAASYQVNSSFRYAEIDLVLQPEP